MSSETSEYLLLFRGTCPAPDMSPEDMQARVEKWMTWYNGLEKEGKVIGGKPLTPGGNLVTGADATVLTDGPFTEAKEAIAGFFHLKVASLEEATEIAKGCPGLATGGSVEVRQIGEKCESSSD